MASASETENFLASFSPVFLPPCKVSVCFQSLCLVLLGKLWGLQAGTASLQGSKRTRLCGGVCVHVLVPWSVCDCEWVSPVSLGSQMLRCVRGPTAVVGVLDVPMGVIHINWWRVKK